MGFPIPGHDDLVREARRFAPSVLLPVLARVSNAQLSGQDSPVWPHPWTVALAARECIASSNEHRGNRPVTDRDLLRLRNLGVNLRDPYADDPSQPDALDSLLVRYLYQQVPFTSHQPFGELARLLLVCQGDDTHYAALDLKIVTEQFWTDLLGMPLATFVRAGFVVLVLARAHEGWFDPARLADPDPERYQVTPEQVLHVFHRFMAAEMADLKTRAAAGRSSDPALRRLDFNPLAESPFVGLGGGRSVAPSMHLVEQRLSLTAIYYLGQQHFKDEEPAKSKFMSDMGTLIEAYVGRQLDQLPHDALVPEQPYGTRKRPGETCDWVLATSGISTIFESKAARIALPGRLGYPEHLADMQRDVGHALERQVPVTAELIRTGDAVYAGYDLPTEVYAVVVTAEPHLMINSDHYRNTLPDPSCPYVVLSLRELEWFVATVLAGVNTRDLIQALTTSRGQPESVMNAAARALGIDNPPNPLLHQTFDQALTTPAS